MTERRASAGGALPVIPADMTPPDDRALASKCDADPYCAHVPCFQVQLEASRPRQARRQLNACAYHVADVIQAQRAWAVKHELAGGQLTILAIESHRFDLRGFAFSTIPLTSSHPDVRVGLTATSAELERSRRAA